MATDTNDNGANAMSRWRKYFNSFIIAGSVFSGYVISSALAPIYPIEAAVKGIPASQFGFVFGVFNLVYIFASPIYGIYAKTIRPTVMFKIGVGTLSLCTITFGFVNRLPAGAPFLAVSIVIRAVSGLADCAIVIAAYILIIAYNPTDTAAAVFIVDSSYIVGKLLGPTVGTFLYQFGGFSLPFYVIGGVLMVMLAISICWLKDFCHDTEENLSNRPRVIKVIQNPRVVIMSFVQFEATTISGFIQSLLENSLRSLNIPLTRTGFFFMAMMGAFIVSSFISSRLANKFGKFNIIIIVGLVTAATGLVLLGCVSLMPMPMAVGIAVASLIMRGTGYGCVIISSFMELRENMAGDGPKNEATNAFTSGWCTCVYSLGYFVGPTVGGPLYDLIGFSFTCLVMLGLDLIAIILVSSVIVTNCLQSQSRHTTQVIHL